MKQIIGWILIVLGILIVLSTIYSTYLNFTGQSDFPQIFSVQEAQVVPQAGGAEGQMVEMIKNSLKEFIPEDATVKMFNMVAWIMLATFLVFSGSKLVSMGGTLLKTPKKEE